MFLEFTELAGFLQATCLHKQLPFSYHWRLLRASLVFSCRCDNSGTHLREASLHVSEQDTYVSWMKTCGLCHQGSNFHWVTKSATGIWAPEVRKCKGVCFRSVSCCLLFMLACADPSQKMSSPVFALFWSPTEKQWRGKSRQRFIVRHPWICPVDTIVSQCDLGHVVNCFDFFEAVCMMVRARTMQLE